MYIHLKSYTCETYKPHGHGQYPCILKCKHNSEIICHIKFTCTCTIPDLVPFCLLHLKISITEIPHNSGKTTTTVATATTIPVTTPTALVPSAINNKCK